MLKMACFRLMFLVFIAFGTVKARWLELEPYSTSWMISDGIDHDVNYENTLRMGASNSSVSATMLYGEKRCQSIYGFMPCADTMAEGVFLMVMYTYLMMLGEDWIHTGNEALYVSLGQYKAIGASVFQVLMAFPRIVLVIAAGVASTESAARDQVAFGVSMYAGSTLITLTLIWGIRIASNRDKLRGKEPILEHQHQQDLSTKCLPVMQTLPIYLNENGVNIDEITRNIVAMMLLSLIPFATLELAASIGSPATVLFALIVSGVSLGIYFAYQIMSPLLHVRSITYLKEENLRVRFLLHIQRIAGDNLIHENGQPNLEAFKSIFERADKSIDGYMTHEELEGLIVKEFKLGEEHISKEFAKTEILTHFDDDNNGMINLLEFQKGCTKWLLKNKADSSNTFSKNILEQVKEIAIRNERESFTKIEKIMPRILKQVLEKHELVKENGEPDTEKIEQLFSDYDHNKDNEIHRGELQKFIETLSFGVALDHDTIFKELEKDFDKNGQHNTMERKEFVEGFVKWIEKAIKHDPKITDPKQAIAKFEMDSWAEIDTPVNMVKPEASIVYIIFGVAVMFITSGAFMQSILQFSNAAQIPFHLTSFVVFPIAMNTRTVITSLLHAESGVSKNASLMFSKLYDGQVMNNLLGLFTLLTTVYMKGLSWTYSKEVLTIMIPCVVVGLFALKRDTYPLWASICAILLYPIYVYLYCVYGI